MFRSNMPVTLCVCITVHSYIFRTAEPLLIKMIKLCRCLYICSCGHIKLISQIHEINIKNRRSSWSCTNVTHDALLFIHVSVRFLQVFYHYYQVNIMYYDHYTFYINLYNVIRQFILNMYAIFILILEQRSAS